MTESINFSETFQKFLELADQVLKYNVAGDLVLNSGMVQANKLQMGVSRYKKIFEITKNNPEEHIKRMKEVYTKCKPILMECKSIEDFGDKFKEMSITISVSQKSTAKVYVCLIFRNCCRIAAKIEEEMEKNPEKANVLIDDPAGTYADIYMLLLLRLFTFCGQPEEIDTYVNPLLKELDESLKLNSGDQPILSDGTEGLFNELTAYARDLGVNIPNGAKFTTSQMREYMSKMMQNPNTKETLKDILKDFNSKDPASIGKIFGKFAEKMKTVGVTP